MSVAIAEQPQALSQAEARADLEWQHLKHARVELDTNAALYAPEEIGLVSKQPYGEELSVIGEVGLPNGDSETLDAVLVKMGSSYGENRYLVGGLKEVGGQMMVTGKWIELTDNSTLPFGRAPQDGNIQADQLWDQDAYSDQVSRAHVHILRRGDEITVEDTSSNGTDMKLVEKDNGYDLPFVSDDPISFAEHTISSEERARIRGMIVDTDQNEKLFAGRPTISRDTFPIEGHVDIRSWGSAGQSEAIVIDSKRGPEQTQEYTNLRNKVYEKLGNKVWAPELDEADVLKAIYDAVDETLEYDLKFVNEFSKTVTTDHRKVDLSLYLEEGKGVCRHMALAASWLGGEMAAKGYLKGRLTAEVNQRISDNAAHEWGRYTAADGTVYIIDPAQHYFGKLAEAVDGKHWDYFRPGERAKYTAGKSALQGSLLN
jgi:hypothetical protein